LWMETGNRDRKNHIFNYDREMEKNVLIFFFRDNVLASYLCRIVFMVLWAMKP